MSKDRSSSVKWKKLINIATVGLFLVLLLIGLNRNKALAGDRVEIKDARAVASQNVSFIELKHDHLSVKVQDISLRELLEEIARQGGMPLEVNTSLEENITVQFHDLPLEEGLRQILQNQSFTLEYTEHTLKKGPWTISRPTKLSIFPMGDRDSPVQITAIAGKSVHTSKGSHSQSIVIDDPELENALSSDNPEERKEVYKAVLDLVEEEDPTRVEEVEEAFKEYEKSFDMNISTSN